MAKVDKILEGLTTINENTGICVVCFFNYDKQHNNTDNLKNKIIEQVKAVDNNVTFKNKVKTQTVLELYFQGDSEYKDNIIKNINKALTEVKINNLCTVLSVYSVL